MCIYIDTYINDFNICIEYVFEQVRSVFWMNCKLKKRGYIGGGWRDRERSYIKKGLWIPNSINNIEKGKDR